MAERKPLFLDQTEGFHEEMATSDSITLGGLTMGGDVTMGGNKITGLGAGTSPGDALSYGQSSATLSGLDLSNQVITSLADGVNDDDAATVGQVNAVAASGLSAGDGIDITAGTIAVDLADTDPALSFDGSDDLQVDVVSSGGILKQSDGLLLKLDETPDTLDLDSDGLKVVGLPSLFKVNDTAVGATVSATSLDTLTDGSNADALHIHAAAVATEAPKVENDLAVDESISLGDPVYFTAAGDRVGKSDAGDNGKSRVVGVARLAQASIGSTTPVVSAGECAGILSGATPGVPWYLQDGGGIGTVLPGSNKRVIQVGIAASADDLWVRIVDYGKQAV